MKKLLKETGIRDISKLKKRYSNAEIYFHQDGHIQEKEQKIY
jgi:hypothetical protein